MWDDDGRIITSPPHEERPQDSHATYLGGERPWRGTGDICGVLPMIFEVSGVSGVWVPREGTHPRNNQISFYVPTL